MNFWNASVVVATRNRPGPLRECLASITEQNLTPIEILIIDSSDSPETQTVAAEFGRLLTIQYHRSAHRSAARQRNEGIARARGEFVVFLDDDVVLQKGFFAEFAQLFEADTNRFVGGVSAIIEDCSFTRLSVANRLLLLPALGWTDGRLGGRLVGPAANFIPEDSPNAVQSVDWLVSGCTAYRRAALARHRFAESFAGYSFAEDVHLSARIGRTWKLLNTTRARVHHKDLGKDTHRDWAAFGEMMILNRHAIMTKVLERDSVADYLRLFYYELVYGTVSFYWLDRHDRNGALRTLSLMKGRLRGAWKLLMGRSPHRTATEKIPAEVAAQ